MTADIIFRLPQEVLQKFQPETNGTSAARRHIGKPVILCLISHLALSRCHAISVFRLPQSFHKGFAKVSDYSFRPALSGCLQVGHPSDFFLAPPCVAQIPTTPPCNVNKLVAHANESLQSIHFWRK